MLRSKLLKEKTWFPIHKRNTFTFGIYQDRGHSTSKTYGVYVFENERTNFTFGRYQDRGN